MSTLEVKFNSSEFGRAVEFFTFQSLFFGEANEDFGVIDFEEDEECVDQLEILLTEELIQNSFESFQFSLI